MAKTLADLLGPVTANPTQMRLADAMRNAYARPKVEGGSGALNYGAGLLGMVPGIGDALGFANDVNQMRKDPEQRTPMNMGLAALGLIPFVPPAVSYGLGKFAKARGVDIAPLPTGPAASQAGAIVYHGSPHKFDQFDLSAARRGVDGIWATDSKPYAEMMAGKSGNTYKVDANIQNPYVFDIMEEAKRTADQIGIAPPANPLEAQELLAGGMGWDSVVSDALHEAKRKGHDVLQIKNFNDGYASNPFDTTNAYVFPSSETLKILERNGQSLADALRKR
jgi:hypothetical protein